MDCLFLRPSSLPPRLFSPPRPRGCSVQLHNSIHQADDNVERCSTGTSRGCLANYHSKFLDRKFTFRRRPHEWHRANAAPENHSGLDSDAPDSKGLWNAVITSLNVFYKFSRPHTVIGTVIGIFSVSLLAVQNLSDLSPLFVSGLLEAVVAAVFMNVYIVGLNQLCDIEIDKVNKPYLPLASGEYSIGTGVAIVSAFALMSFGVGWLVGSWPLLWALFITFILGTAYSINMSWYTRYITMSSIGAGTILVFSTCDGVCSCGFSLIPYLRWKRSAVVAAICILVVRAVIVQLTFFLHMQTFVLRRPVKFTRSLIFATAFMSFFSVVIALFKDIPDIHGDRIFGIRSFSVRLGQTRVFWICIFLLEMAYSVAMVIGATSSCNWSKFITVFGHMALGSILWHQAKSLDLKSKDAITSFYMFIWKLFYAEYLLIPLVR